MIQLLFVMGGKHLSGLYRICARPKLASVGLLSVLLFCRCLDDAPHENPLDPHGGRFSPIEGKVFSLFAPHRPIDEAVVWAPSEGLTDTTDSNGMFTLLYVPPESILIVADAPEYAPCSLIVGIDPDSRYSVVIYLNGLPVIENATVYSTYEALWYPEPFREWVTIKATLSDPDGASDIDSVICTLPGGGIVSLEPGQQVGNYSAWLSEDILGPDGAEALVGREVLLQAFDRQGQQSAEISRQMVRVVRDVGELTRPFDLEEVGHKPTLSWVPPQPAYESSLRVKVVRLDHGVETNAWQSDLLPISTDSVMVADYLSDGTYYWVVYTIDLFENSGRSREVTFKVGDTGG